MQVWNDEVLSLAPLQGKTIAIVGYGNQGCPQALNLRDSGLNVVVGARTESHSGQNALKDGFMVVEMADVPHHADVLALLLPDDQIGPVATQWIEKEALNHCHTVIVGHGLSLHAGWAKFPKQVAVGLVAPKGQGKGVRAKFLESSGVPGLVAIHQGGKQGEAVTLNILQAYAKAIGCGRAGVYYSTVAEETICDLFSEQAVLCGGLSHLIVAAFETLVRRGYNPEVAAIECQYEVNLIADLLQTQGMAAMRQAISPAALYGDLSRGPRIVDSHVRQTLETVLDEIENGQFAREMGTQTTPQLRQQARQAVHSVLEEAYEQVLTNMNN